MRLSENYYYFIVFVYGCQDTLVLKLGYILNFVPLFLQKSLVDTIG